MGQSESVSSLNVRAWKSKADYIYPTPKDYPENDLPELLAKPSTAIAFSGGGSRAMMTAFGFLAGLRDIGVMHNIRYVGGTSGGSWAVIIFCYGRLHQDDNVFLGPIVRPEFLTMEMLEKIDEDCVRRLASHDFSLQDYLSVSFDRASAWMTSVSDKLMAPAGIEPGRLFSWDEVTVEEILARNPRSGLTEEHFLLPRKLKGPFMVVGWTLIGPEKTIFDAAIESDSRNYRFIEVTPLYIGQFYSKTSSYGAKKFLVGGAIEPFAFAMKGGAAPEKGLGPYQSTGELSVPKPDKMLDLSSVASTTSYIGRGNVSLSNMSLLDSLFSWSYDYWSPVEERPAVTRTLFADAASLQNDPLIPFIQRGVEKIVNVSSSAVIINYAELTDYSSPQNWKHTKTVSAKYIDPNIASFFGIMPVDLSSDTDRRSIEYDKNHIFVSSQFQELIEGLLEVSSKGFGTYYRKKWLTVDNPFYGIRGGQYVDVTFYLLQPSKEWEGRLPAETYDKVFQSKLSSSNIGLNLNIPDSAKFSRSASVLFMDTLDPHEFDGFPLYDGSKFHLTNKESNLICNLVGWTVTQNRDFFADIFC